MIYLRQKKVLLSPVLFLSSLFALMCAQSVLAQIDPIGTIDRVYIDSVEAAPGEQVVVGFRMANDEPLSSVSVPITYDPNLMTLVSIDFNDTRLAYLTNRLLKPADATTAAGHFLVGVFVLFEAPIPAGDGPIFKAVFEINPDITETTMATIDSLFYAPGGEMILVEAELSRIIRPQFDAGQVLISFASGTNHVPVLASIPPRTVFEGEMLNVAVGASDLDKDVLIFSSVNLPSGASLESSTSEQATLSWQPDFVGPYSADGSPFKFTLRVSDGQQSATGELIVNVINKNRPPVLSSSGDFDGDAGDEINIEISAFDPDFDALDWEITGLPQGASFDYGASALLSWQSSLNDTGLHRVQIKVSDPNGYSDEISVNIQLAAVVMYTVTLDETSSYPGETFAYHVNLDNLFPIGSFDLLINYDPSALIFVNATTEGTRAESFEYFNASTNLYGVPGNMRLIGIADQNGSGLLDAGNGAVARINFRVSSDISLSGMSAPVRFVVNELVENDDNTLTDTLGAVVQTEAIALVDGSVFILSLGTLRVGDINLNGVAYDIGDAIYLSNFFMNPISYPLNPLQYANSDVNGDAIGGTIGDLVKLINIIVTGSLSSPKPIGVEPIAVSVFTEVRAGQTKLVYNTPAELGGVLMTFESGERILPEMITNLADGMTLLTHQKDTQVRMLVYSLDGNRLSAGETSLIEWPENLGLNLTSVSIADADGQLVEVELAAKQAPLPDKFVLNQNYPNPFNPETHISFDLPQSGQVVLTVYNILGAKVKTLLDETLPAGSHTTLWDGRDDNGASVASGVYLYRLETAGTQQTRKMMLLK